MRISTNMVNADFLNNLATTTNKVQNTMNQLASLKEVNKASDNPLLVSKILERVYFTKQFIRNDD